MAVAYDKLLHAPLERAEFFALDGQNWLEATVRLGRRVDAYEEFFKVHGLTAPQIDERPAKQIEAGRALKAKELGL